MVLSKLQRGFLCIIGITMVLLLTFDGLGRYLLGRSISWAEELTRILFVWGCFLSISIAFVKKAHIGLDSIAKINVITQKISEIVTALSLLIVGVAIVYWGSLFVKQSGRFPLPATGFPIIVLYIAGVLAGAAWIGIGIYQILSAFRFREGER